MVTSCQSLVNGEPVTTVSVMDRGLAYGDGVFETIALIGGRAPLWRYHWQRLQDAGRRLGLPVPAELDLLDQCRQLAGADDRCVAKITVTRGAAGRGYRPPEVVKPTVIVQRFDWPPRLPSNAEGLRLGVCATRLGRQSQLAGIKHLCRLEQVLLQQELSKQDWDDGLVCDTSGLVIEAAQANIFFVGDGELFTPRLDWCGVNGVCRALLFELYNVTENDLKPSDLKRFAGAFTCNAIRGVMPVREIVGCVRYDVATVQQVAVEVNSRFI